MSEDNGTVVTKSTTTQIPDAILDQANTRPLPLAALAVADDKDWGLKPAPVSRDWMEAHNRFAYRCLPLTIANASGWIITSPISFTASWLGGLSPTELTLTKDDPLDKHRHSIVSLFGSGIITFNLPWLFRVARSRIGMRVRGMPNYWKFNCTPLEGYVEIDWNPFTFTMNWKLQQPNIPVAFAKGDPICFLELTTLDLTDAAEPVIASIQQTGLNNAYREYLRSRQSFNADPHKFEKPWQKFYHNGFPLADGTTIEPPAHHRTGFKAKPFEDLRRKSKSVANP
jgi:hypothetical protein